MRHLVMAVAASMALGLGLVLVLGGSSPEDVLDRELLLMEVREQGLLAPEAEGADKQALWLLAAYGQEAYLAEQRFPDKAFTLYAHFGEVEAFQEILQRYGYQQVLPIVWYFWENESISFQLKTVVGRGLELVINFFTGKKEENDQPLALTPVQRALMAVYRIRESGNNFLGRFVISKEGQVQPLVLNHIISITEELLTGSLQKIEAKLRTQEKVTIGDILGAGIELTIVSSIGFKVFKLWKGVKGAASAAKSAKLAKTAKASRVKLVARAALLAPKAVAKSRVAKLGAVGLGVYLVAANPKAFNAFLGSVATAVGIPPIVLQGIIWGLLLVGPILLAIKLIKFFPFRWRAAAPPNSLKT